MKGVITSVLFFCCILSAGDCLATPEYSGRTEQGCMTCHIKAEGGALTEKGLEYAASGYVWPPEGGYRVLGIFRKWVRLIIGSLHVTASFIWFGTILYVHLLLRPAYASKGLPKEEVMLGLASMFIVGATGVLLTVSRIRGFDVLYGSPWGIVLLIKIALFFVMVLSALFVVTFVGPRLRRGQGGASLPDKGIFNASTLSAFDGKESRPSFIAFKGKVYDMAGLNHWRGGIHMKHRCGEDLTDAISKAPHGEEKLMGLKEAGTFDAQYVPPKNPAQSAFYFIAYMNLALVFAVIFVISFWRWGI